MPKYILKVLQGRQVHNRRCNLRKAVWYMLITVSVAYGYVHSTPAALKFAGEFTDNHIKKLKNSNFLNFFSKQPL